MNLLNQFPMFGPGTMPMGPMNSMGSGPQQMLMMMLGQMTQMCSMLMGLVGGGFPSQAGGFGPTAGPNLLGWGAGLPTPGFSPPFPGYSPSPNGFPMPYAGQAPFPQGESCAPSFGGQAGTTAFGRSVHNAITQYCSQNPPPGRHLCYQWVANALDRVGVHLQGGSAYMAADQLARNSKFKEVKVPKEQLSSLPAGAIVVWAGNPGGTGHGHGHISIATGDGNELSDRKRKQITNYGQSFRVFLPK